MSLRVLITGATGMLGRDVLAYLKKGLPNAEVTTISRSEFQHPRHFKLDLTDIEALTEHLKKHSYDFLIHCAAFVDLAYCREHPEQTELLHVTVPRILSDSIETVFYISTDSVFNGQTGGYIESDPTEPLNDYAKSKRKGEFAVLEHARNPFVIRSNIYGFHTPSGRSLFEWAYQSLLNGKGIKGFENVFFNPLYTGQLAEMIIRFYNKDPDSGIYHFGTSNATSKYDFLRKVAHLFEFNEELISPVKIESSLSDPRPLNTILDTKKLERLGVFIPTLESGLELLKENFKTTGL